MEIRALSLINFRNYKELHSSFSPHINVIYGENAQGKTNLLEGAAYLAGAKSHRTRGDKELIAFDQEFAEIKGTVLSRNRLFTVEIGLHKTARRRISINQVKQKTAQGLSDILRTVFFSPEDLYLIWEGAAARRRFIDHALGQLRPRYAQALSQYQKHLDHKTRILRDWEEKPSLLSALEEFNDPLARFGATIIQYRAKYIQELKTQATEIHRDCSGSREEISLFYQTVKTVTDPFAPVDVIYEQLLDHQKSHHSAELASKTCLSGPHKDDLLVDLNGRPIKSFGSQGQVRTAALSLKLAERELHFLDTGEYPVLFLDDVLSELDQKRQNFVLNHIMGGQIFLSCCQKESLGLQKKGTLFHIENGAARLE